MNKLIILFICLLAVPPVSIYSQQAEITGRVTTSGNEPVEYANVQLLNADSVFLKGTTSGKDGKFKIDTPSHKDYRLMISALGYETLQITLNDIREKSTLGELVLTESSVALDEVTVSANRVIQKIDRQITYPSRIALESSNNALELLKKMSLPRVIVNPMEKEITLAGNESIKLRINGIDANPTQISALRAKDIVRIDYYDNPGVRVQESAIIDFIVKRRDSGGYASTDLSNAPYMAFGSDMISSKFNHKNSEWSVFYNLLYRNLKKKYTESTNDYFFPGEKIIQQTMGIPSQVKPQFHTLNLSYNYTLTDKRVFNVTLSGSLLNYMEDQKENNYYSNNPGSEFPSHVNLSQKERNPVLDLYYKETLTKNQTLFLNLVTGYIYTDYLRNYQEKNENGGQDYTYKNRISGNKYSAIGEAAHQVRWSKLILYSGINYKMGYTRNDYKGDNDEKSSLNNSDLYFYSQLQGRFGNLSFSAGAGASYSYFSDQDQGFRYWTFRPSLSLAYSFAKNINIRYIFDVNQTNPTLSELSNVMQIEDRFRATKGNPDLKPYRIYANMIQLNYQGERIQWYIGAFHRYYSNVIMNDIYFDETSNRFIQAPSNQKYLQAFSPYGGLNWMIINDLLDFSLDGQILRMKSKGIDYSHTYTTYYLKGQLNFNLKHWKAGIGIKSPSDFLWGEIINYEDWRSTVEIGYRHKDLYLGLQAINFLTSRTSSGSKNLSELTPGTTWTYTNDAAPIIFLNLSWNFSWGKQSKTERKNLQNKDMDSGIRKAIFE